MTLVPSSRWNCPTVSCQGISRCCRHTQRFDYTTISNTSSDVLCFQNCQLSLLWIIFRCQRISIKVDKKHHGKRAKNRYNLCITRQKTVTAVRCRFRPPYSCILQRTCARAVQDRIVCSLTESERTMNAARSTNFFPSAMPPEICRERLPDIYLRPAFIRSHLAFMIFEIHNNKIPYIFSSRLQTCSKAMVGL